MSYFISPEPDSSLEDVYYFHMLRLGSPDGVCIQLLGSRGLPRHADADTSGPSAGLQRARLFVVSQGGGQRPRWDEDGFRSGRRCPPRPPK